MKTKILITFIICICHVFILAEEVPALIFEYQNEGIIISSKDKSFTARIENTYDGMYQISKDKTKMIVFTESESEDPYYNSIYYIDSKKRQKKLIMKNWQNAMSDLNINFIFCQKDINNPFSFYLYDITKNKSVPVILKVNNPKVTEQVFLSVQIYRSLDKRFDFILDFSSDAYTAAEYGFSLKKKKFIKIFDKTSEPETSYKILDERSPFEVGW